MTNTERLRAWADTEARENGLVDVKFFLSDRADFDDAALERAAGVVLTVLSDGPHREPMGDAEL